MNVYVIASEGGMCKIGKANDPEKRMRELSTGHPYRLVLAKVFPMASVERSLLIERRAHELLVADRMSGEWFQIAPERAISVIASIVGRADGSDVRFGTEKVMGTGLFNAVIDAAARTGEAQGKLLNMARSRCFSPALLSALFHEVAVIASSIQSLIDCAEDDDDL